MSTIWSFDLGKASIGEAVRDINTNEFLHKASLLIPAEFASTKDAATRRRMWRTRQAHKAREAWLDEVWRAAGQEPLAGNMRGVWALNPCVQNGTSCESGDECCSGFCRQTSADDGGPVLSCVPQPAGCSQEYEKCTTTGDCCRTSDGHQRLNGYCVAPAAN